MTHITLLLILILLILIIVVGMLCKLWKSKNNSSATTNYPSNMSQLAY